MLASNPVSELRAESSNGRASCEIKPIGVDLSSHVLEECHCVDTVYAVYIHAAAVVLGQLPIVGRKKPKDTLWACCNKVLEVMLSVE